MQRYQIHIAGVQCAGKKTLAHAIAAVMKKYGHRPVVFDSNDTRSCIFGNHPRLPDRSSEDMKWIRRFGYDAMFGVRIRDILMAGGSSIMVATHAWSGHYARAQEIAARHDAKLRFVVLETPSLSEVDRRSRLLGNWTDFQNMTDSQLLVGEFRNVSAAIAELYGVSFEEPHLKVPQVELDKIEAVASEVATKFIMSDIMCPAGMLRVA